MSDSTIGPLSQPYVYQKLSTQDGGQYPNTRLLTLEPALNYEAPLIASLEECRLNEVNNKFEALSYTWGEPVFTETLSVDEKVLKITKNLHDCLRRLRQEHPRRLWIDAVCINQADTDERTAQVAIMGQIYSSAIRTLSWLGEPPELDGWGKPFLASAVVDFIEREASRLRESLMPDIEDYVKRAIQVWPAQESAGLPKVSIQAITDFYTMEYFKRRWVIQEIALAREVQLIWGSHHLTWGACRLVVSYLDFQLHVPRSGLPAHSSETWLIPKSRGSNVLEVMFRFLDAKCADPRDRVGALQSLWRGHESPLDRFLVDYSQSVRSNYLRFAQAAVQTSDWEQLLFCAALTRPFTEKLEESLDLPSWVPDWRSGNQHWLGNDKITDRNSASCCSLGPEDTLTLKAWFLDSITTITDVYFVTSRSPCRWSKRADLSTGDRICTFSYGHDLDIPRFIVRKTGPGRFKLIDLCIWLYDEGEASVLDENWIDGGIFAEIVLE